MKISVRSLDANTDKMLYRNLPKTGSRQDIHQKMNEQKLAHLQNGLLFRNKKMIYVTMKIDMCILTVQYTVNENVCKWLPNV